MKTTSFHKTRSFFFGATESQTSLHHGEDTILSIRFLAQQIHVRHLENEAHSPS